MDKTVIEVDKNGEVTAINDEKVTTYKVVFNKPYVFEDKEYKEVDLAGMENMSAADMIAAQKVLDRSGTFSVLPEMSLQYACVIASRATKMPIEFFEHLPMKEAIKLKNRVTSFFYGQD